MTTDRDGPAPATDPRRRGVLVELFRPRSEPELLLLRSILEDAGLYFFVKNDLFGSLALGPQIDHYNRKTVYVHPEELDEARALLAEFLEKTALGDPGPARDVRLRDVLRMVAELVLFGWFMPGRRPRRRPDPELRLIRGGKATPSPTDTDGD